MECYSYLAEGHKSNYKMRVHRLACLGLTEPNIHSIEKRDRRILSNDARMKEMSRGGSNLFECPEKEELKDVADKIRKH